MESSGRFFLCGHCRSQVLLCGACDRGQIYCGDGCSKVARRRSVREAGRRYQGSRPGRFAHAERARRYRRRRQNVTHQGSPAPSPQGLLPAPSRAAAKQSSHPVLPPPLAVGRCQRCGRRCAAFIRLGFRRRRGSHSTLLTPETVST